MMEEGDDLEEHQDEQEGSDVSFGSNLGQVNLPYIWSKVTHPPEGEEEGRTQKVHIVLQLLSGTHAKMGYLVHCRPKSNSITIEHQKGLDSIFWGPSGRGLVPAGVARDTMASHCSETTNNFTEIPNQVQIIEFPFALTSILKKKPFFVKVHDGPAGKYLGLYICAKIDWVDQQAAGAGDEYTELLSPAGATPLGGTSSYYNTTPAVSNVSTRPAGGTPATPNYSKRRGGIRGGRPRDDRFDHLPPQNLDNLSGGEGHLVRSLIERLNIVEQQSHNLQHQQLPTPSIHTPTRTRKQSVVAATTRKKSSSASKAAAAPVRHSAPPRVTSSSSIVSSFSNALGGLAGYGSTAFSAKKLSPAEETAVTAASTFAPEINKDSGEDEDGLSYDEHDNLFDINDDYDESDVDESDEEEVSEFICEEQNEFVKNKK
jgi:hypothetical protein